jgi:hypothetical protein
MLALDQPMMAMTVGVGTPRIRRTVPGVVQPGVPGPGFLQQVLVAECSVVVPAREARMACWEAGDHKENPVMTHPLGTQPAYRRTPLSAEEKARGEANFSPLVAQALVANGRFRVSADTLEMVELWQGVARRVGEMLQRPVVSYANGRHIVITFGQEETPASLAEAPAQHRIDRQASSM